MHRAGNCNSTYRPPQLGLSPPGAACGGNQPPYTPAPGRCANNLVKPNRMAAGKQARIDEDKGDEKRQKASISNFDVGNSGASLYTTASGKPVALSMDSVSRALEVLDPEGGQKAVPGRQFSAPRAVENHGSRGPGSAGPASGSAFMAAVPVGNERDNAGGAAIPRVDVVPVVKVDAFGFEIDWESVDMGALDDIVDEAIAANARRRSGSNPAEGTGVPSNETTGVPSSGTTVVLPVSTPAGDAMETGVPPSYTPPVVHRGEAGETVVPTGYTPLVHRGEAMETGNREAYTPYVAHRGVGMGTSLPQAYTPFVVRPSEAMGTGMRPASTPAVGHSGEAIQTGTPSAPTPAVVHRVPAIGRGMPRASSSAVVHRGQAIGRGMPRASNLAVVHRGPAIGRGMPRAPSPAVVHRGQVSGTGVPRASTANVVDRGTTMQSGFPPASTPAFVDGWKVMQTGIPPEAVVDRGKASETSPSESEEVWKEGDLFKNTDGRMVPLSARATKVALIFFGSEEASASASDTGNEQSELPSNVLEDVELKKLSSVGDTPPGRGSDAFSMQGRGKASLEPYMHTGPLAEASSSMANRPRSAPQHRGYKPPLATIQVQETPRPRQRLPGHQPAAFSAPRSSKR